MKILRYVALFFLAGYTMMSLHYLGFDRAARAQSIEEGASRIKDIKPALTYRQKEYKEFVYAH